MSALQIFYWRVMPVRFSANARAWFTSKPGLNCKYLQKQTYSLKFRNILQCLNGSKDQSIIKKFRNIVQSSYFTNNQNQYNTFCLLRRQRTFNASTPHKRNGLLEGQLVSRQHKCSFHTSPRRHIPPILLALLKPLTKVSAALAGRIVRKWYRGLDVSQRKSFLSALRRHWYVPMGMSATLIGSSCVFYYTHLEDTPITGRRRFVVFTHDQILKIAEEEAKNLEEAYKDKMFGDNDHETHRVVDVMMRLLKANPEMNSNLPFDMWKIFVINDSLCNACAMPNGNVFVFRGMLEVASSQDELAIVMGHEVAHSVLSHSIEELSLTAFVNYFVILCLAGIWCILPNDGIAAITHWFYNKVIQLTTHMPHSRTLEKEADKVGLMFAAKACFDVRVGSVLWKKMSLNDKLQRNGGEALPEWMSTHPDNEKRADHLDFLLPQAEEWRDSMECPCLPTLDPRKAVIAVSEKVDNLILARKTGQNLTHVTKVA